MIRQWASDAAFRLAGFCKWRSLAWARRGEWMVDVSEWLATPATWPEIRERRTERP